MDEVDTVSKVDRKVIDSDIAGLDLVVQPIPSALDRCNIIVLRARTIS